MVYMAEVTAKAEVSKRYPVLAALIAAMPIPVGFGSERQIVAFIQRELDSMGAIGVEHKHGREIVRTNRSRQ